jgi:hypothetical protein
LFSAEEIQALTKLFDRMAAGEAIAVPSSEAPDEETE